VVIPGASSSVGLAAIQIANSVGAKSIALTRTSAKRKQLTDAGAKYVIATEEEDLVKGINEITGGQGARVVFDPVGGGKSRKAACQCSTRRFLCGRFLEERNRFR
jgi:threonine dehydrogenase-like Zn-dependent dehydrogenase